MNRIRLGQESGNGPIIMIFCEGTVLRPHSKLSIMNVNSYVPAGNAVQTIQAWSDQGADIVYCTSRKGRQAENMVKLLDKYGFTGTYLVSRENNEKYSDLVEAVRPDVLVEDDCKSIGGAWQMCITNVEAELKSRIKSYVVEEFTGIDNVHIDIESLRNE